MMRLVERWGFLIKMEKKIGMIINLTENIKPEYLSKKRRKHPVFAIIEIYKDKKYGVIAKIFERNDFFGRINDTITKKEREKISKSLSKMKFDDKPVDTSKWVKPNEESIRNALIECLFFLEIFKEDYWESKERFGKASAYYSTLHSHRPKNPQHLTNFEIGQSRSSYFETIMREFKVPEGMRNRKYIGVKNHREWFKNWKERCLKNMIIQDKNPPIRKDKPKAKVIGEVKEKWKQKVDTK